MSGVGRKSLTVEQLREMDGHPVKVVHDEAAKETTPGFEPLEMICLVEYVKSAGCVVLRNNVGGESEYYNDEELEQDGLTVYPYYPPRLDRSEWEPCMWCVLNGQFGLNDYCSACGRPLTDEAWAELERRVCGG